MTIAPHPDAGPERNSIDLPTSASFAVNAPNVVRGKLWF